jgi:hypothetical protein
MRIRFELGTVGLDIWLRTNSPVSTAKPAVLETGKDASPLVIEDKRGDYRTG